MTKSASPCDGPAWGGNLRGAALRGADLRGADLRDVNLTNADLEYTFLLGAFYDESTVWPDDFNPVAAGAMLIEQPTVGLPISPDEAQP